MTPSSWVQEKGASKILGLASSTLRRMRSTGQLEPGVHWVYSTGKINSPVLYDIPAINETLRQQTIAAVEARQAEMQKRKQSIETYDEAHLDQLIAEVQS